MANKPLNSKNPSNSEVYSWILYFAFSSWILLGFLFFSGIFKNILLNSDKNFAPATEEKSQIHHVLIDQKKEDSPQTKKQEYFLSDKDNQASGKLTKKKGFENISRSNEMRTGGEKNINVNQNRNLNTKDTQKNKSPQVLSNQFVTKIIHLLKVAAQGGHKSFLGVTEKPSIPSNYEVKKELIFSWDNEGKPVIPTVQLKHFDYFKKMLDKIADNWAPPGGYPYPIFDNRLNTFTRGRTTYQTFPDQKVQIIFQLDSKGNVLETKVYKSLGYKSLDRAFMDAIERSGNFGPPPEELLQEDNSFIMLLICPYISMDP